MAKVEFHFDFGSPNAYLAHLVVPEIEQRTGVEVRIRAGPAGRRLQADQQPLAGEKLAGIKNKLEYEQLETQRFIRQPRHHALHVRIRSSRSTR